MLKHNQYIHKAFLQVMVVIVSDFVLVFVYLLPKVEKKHVRHSLVHHHYLKKGVKMK